MKKISLFLIFTSLFSTIYAQKLPEVTTCKLSNGIEVWMSEDHTRPIIQGSIVIKAGGVDAPNTGIAHYFEHIMFKGSDRIGTVNYKAEKVYLDSIEAKYNELSGCKIEKERDSIQKEINRLSLKAAEFAIPNEFDNLVEYFGGSKLNAGTSYDYTTYFNSFSNEYLEAWAEINSERFRKPVFRLFQSELETVYEEKNMYSDEPILAAAENITSEIFKPHPYMFPIIGSTENLKNPRLDQMREFFNKYYVGKNMGIVLCGDFNSNEAVKILEKHFGKITPGEKNIRNFEKPEEIIGKKEVKLKIPIPIITGSGRVYRGVGSKEEDAFMLTATCWLLTNNTGTGLLDKLSSDGKVLFAGGFSLNMKDAGAIIVGAIPKLLFQSKSKAEKIVIEQLNRIKAGDFSDEMLDAVKTSLKSTYIRGLESISSRANVMESLFVNENNWESYKKKFEKIDKITKDDIVACANKYFGDNYIHISKKTGSYKKDKLKKPDYKPIIPNRNNTASEYSKELKEKYTSKQSNLNLVKDNLNTFTIKENNKCYLTKNPVNNIFSLKMLFEVSQEEDPNIGLVSDYANQLGTDSLDFNTFRSEFQKLGSNISISHNNRYFTIYIEGYENNFEKTVSLLEHYLNNVTNNKNAFKAAISTEKIMNLSSKRHTESIADLIHSKIYLGEAAPTWKKYTPSELRKIKENDLLNKFKNILKYPYTVHYCGNNPDDSVKTAVNFLCNNLSTTKKSATYIANKYINQQTPKVYFYNMKSARQSYIYAVSSLPDKLSEKEKAQLRLFMKYYGSGMNSVIFQEVREFRSLAYMAGAMQEFNDYTKTPSNALISPYLSTQADKTVEATLLLDSLRKNLNITDERVNIAKISTINNINSSYPTFRNISERVTDYKLRGYDSDPNSIFENIDDLDNLKEFYLKNIKDAPTSYIIVGNKKKINFEELKKLGEIVEITNKDIFKK